MATIEWRSVVTVQLLNSTSPCKRTERTKQSTRRDTPTGLRHGKGFDALSKDVGAGVDVRELDRGREAREGAVLASKPSRYQKRMGAPIRLDVVAKLDRDHASCLARRVGITESVDDPILGGSDADRVDNFAAVVSRPDEVAGDGIEQVDAVRGGDNGEMGIEVLIERVAVA